MIEWLKSIANSGGGFAAVGAALIATWSYIKSISRYCFNLLIGECILHHDAGKAMKSFVFNKKKSVSMGIKEYMGSEAYVHPKRWREAVAYEVIGHDPFIINYGWNPMVFISKVGGNDEVRLYYFRWFFNPDKFICDAMEYYNSLVRQSGRSSQSNKTIPNRFRIHRFSGKDKVGSFNIKSSDDSNKNQIEVPPSPSTLGESMLRLGLYRLLKWNISDLQQKHEGNSPFEGYPFPLEIHNSLKELEIWLSNEQWFRSKSIPWRRGWLLHGPPGTGKSTLVRTIGMSFNLPLYIFDLSGMTNNEFVDSWDSMLNNTPCIALIEDIDAIFNGREFIGSKDTHNQHLTFDCLLNCISGVKQADGVFLVITTNHLEKLDPALGIPDKNGKVTRPGRIDRAIHLGNMEEPQRRSLAQYILSDFPHLVEETVKNGEGETPAQFQSRCSQLALAEFWKNKESST